MKKRILLGGCAAILLAIAACIGGSLYLIDYALRPERQEPDLQAAIKEECGNYPFITPWIDSLVTHKALRDTFITADDGCALHAFYVYAAKPTRKTALLIHGYGGQATGMLPIGYMYNRSLDYNILLPDLRRAGQSGGEAIQMGWLDRLDVKQWIDTAPSLFGDSLRIVVHGVSMGGATTMMVSGEKLPEYVDCFVDDCGYTSVWDEFALQLDNVFGLPSFPLLNTAELVCRVHMLEHHIIVYCHIAGSLICHMHVVSLFYKTDECSSHRNHIIVRMRREDDHPFRERGG